MHRRLFAVSALLLGLTIGSVPEATAATGWATLEGRVISVRASADLACHDLAYPRITCFGTTAKMEADVAQVLERGGLKAARTLATGYVIVYEDAGFGGSSRTLSVDYSNLGTIGWSDRISSFKSFGAIGEFREHTPPGGFTYGFVGSTQVSSLSGTYNDKFSSFQID